ncbi:MAG: hypothetical protein CNLJKLNK_01445 [Holosporales bacterium]
MKSTKNWQFIFDEKAEKQFSKLDKPIKKQITQGLEKIIISQDPKALASPLKGIKSQFWRYRIGNYRIIVRFEDNDFIIVAVKIGHRRLIYK